MTFVDNNQNSHIDNISLRLAGSHQTENAALAIETICILANKYKWRISEAAIRRALGTLSLSGRLDWIPGGVRQTTVRNQPNATFGNCPALLIDAAHTPESACQLAEFVASRHIPRRKAALVFACAADKNAKAILSTLYPCFGTWIFTRFDNNPRSADPFMLKKTLHEIVSEVNKSAANTRGLPAVKTGSSLDSCTVFEPSSSAMTAVSSLPGLELVCAAGSFYLAAQVYDWIDKQKE